MPFLRIAELHRHLSGVQRQILAGLLTVSLSLSFSSWAHGEAGKGLSASVTESLKITEIMYNPPTGGVDYIEFQNVGLTALDVSGVTFRKERCWTQGPITCWQPMKPDFLHGIPE